MKLDESQQKQVTAWIEQGLELSEIQKRISEEFKIGLTYMEVRFLVDDLGVQIKEAEPEPEPEEATEPTAEGDGDVPADDDGSDVPPPSGVSVSVDQITRPGFAVSGKVTFSDGKNAEWYVDQMGRPGLVPEEEGYRPSQEDIMEFQIQLQDKLRRSGFPV